MAKIVMSFGLIILISITIGVYADTEDNEVDEELHMYNGVKVYQMEKNCAMVGGLCAKKTDCIQETTNKALCPTNQHLGVECCFELKIVPAPCEQHAGQCMNHCHPRLQKPGTDCVDGQVCCVLVN